jgi:alanine racemase
MSRGTLASISQTALLNNIKRVKEYAPSSKIWVVVKANAYGHGAVGIAKMVPDADGFAVATLREADELRAEGIESNILLLEGCPSFGQMQTAIESRYTLVLHDMQQVQWFLKLQIINPVDVWIKVDTGMHRLGLLPEEVSDAHQMLSSFQGCHSISVMTHLACADDIEHEYNDQQLSKFISITDELDFSEISIANSATIITREECTKDWVRPGIMLYGASPLADQSAKSLGLAAVMTLTAPVIALRTIQEGQSAGYGATWTAKKKTTLATIAIGYGDGYPRHAKLGTPIYFQGKTYPLVGRVSMDMISIDVSEADIQLGDKVELWGQNLAVDHVAKWCDTIGYELLTRLSLRVEYHYI